MKAMFKDRFDAGNALFNLLEPYIDNNTALFAIPNGGIPVALPIIEKMNEIYSNIKLNLILVRKIPIPEKPEAGFGAITLNGFVLFNGPLVTRMNLHEREIERLIQKVQTEINQRKELFGTRYQNFAIRDKSVILIDDGLATGITMTAAIQSIQEFNPLKIIVAVPTASRLAVNRIQAQVDVFICPNIRETFFFATQAAYENYHDVSNLEVQHILLSNSVLNA